MKNIVLIIGARPNFMKAFPVYESLKNDFELTLIHTGQHFDEKMSKVFFEQLKFPHPDIHLTLDKRTKAGDFDDKLYNDNIEYLKNKDQVIDDLMKYQGELGQLGEIRDKLKKEFEKLNPDLVMVFGDVTSTLAAGLASKMLNIDIAHVESGLRSGDTRMPEEVNRILTDHITKYYFVTEQSGVDNLKEGGITENVYLVGNTMIDTQKKYLQQALDTKYHETLRVETKEYILITLHRPSNVDDMDKLKEIFDDLEELSKTETLIYPIHPRTKNNLDKLGYLKKVIENPNIILEEPLGYLEFTCLMAHCKYVVTDSGGLQEETTSLDISCFTLRENTERPCTLLDNHGTNQMIHKISEIELKKCKGSMDLWDGKSSERIKDVIEKINNFKTNNIDYTIFDHPLIGWNQSSKIGLLRVYENQKKYESELILKMPHNSSFLDIGANYGDTVFTLALYARNNNRSDVRFFAFEPSKIKYKYMKKIAKLNRLNITFFNNCVGDDIKKKAKYDGIVEQLCGGCSYEISSTGDINVITLDSIQNIISPVGIIHIDTEGWETNVLKGSSSLIKNTQHEMYIIMECWGDIVAEQQSKLNRCKGIDLLYPAKKIHDEMKQYKNACYIGDINDSNQKNLIYKIN